ncbi:MAG: DUF5916 domain-containing protein [bacterium]
MPIHSALSNDDDAATNKKEITVTRIESDPPHLDGTLDEEVWNQAYFVSDFLQRNPNEGETAMNKTEVGFLYDDEALYVGARMYFNNSEELQAYVTRRDRAGNSERIIVSLDTYYDRRTAYSFGVTAAGVRLDYYHPQDHSYRGREYSFNPVWDAEAAIDSIGWGAEMKIPFSQLRFSNREKQVWGVNINRWLPNTNEDLYWVLVPKNETGWASRFGDLVGLNGIKPSRRIEFLPYETSSATLTSDIDPDNPFHSGHEFDSRVGLDLKMGLGPNLTMDATVNPDFGQVEADPAEVNLTAFETFFPEKRPFFIEGRQLFENDGPAYFYSRRIGAPPHGETEGDYDDTPENTTILSAAKLTGRLNSGLSVGVLGAITAREQARTYFSDYDSTGRSEVEPLIGYGVMRLQQEFGPSASTVGLMFTGIRRDVSPGDSLAKKLNRQAYGGNTDWNLRFQGGKYVVRGHLGFSFIQGHPLAIVRAQRSSARYFQRPDANHVTLDSTRTSLFGYTGAVEFSKNSGEHWLWEAEFSAISPTFEINDVGRLRTADLLSFSGSLRYRENTPGTIFRDYRLQLGYSNNWNYAGDRLRSNLELELNATWKNFWRSSLDLSYRPAAFSATLTRGGPIMGTGAEWQISTRLSSSRAAKTNWSGSFSYSKDELDGWGYNANGRLTFKPGDRWELSVNPHYSRKRNPRQYFDTYDGGRQETFDKRVIFSFIDRSTLSAQFRLNYALTPDLSLEVYAEPFAASGHRFKHGELLNPRSRHLRFYGTDGTTLTENEDGTFLVTDGDEQFKLENKDFNNRSFRSNFVLRWEWRRGSTFFLVWQQDRSAEKDAGDLVTPGSLFDSFSAEGDNFLAVKFSYWLPVD